MSSLRESEREREREKSSEMEEILKNIYINEAYVSALNILM
jgi:hypothetical protein